VSWFYYKDQPNRKLRRGIWLRVHSLPEPVVKEAKKYMKIGEYVDFVIVHELRPKNQVMLEFHCRRLLAPIQRSILIHIIVDEDPEWICEGDLGRGLIGLKKATQ